MGESSASVRGSGSDVQPLASVLLVEDDADFRQIAAKGLSAQGFHVIEAGSAEEALKIAGGDDVVIDVVVLDIMLPDSWGSQVGIEQSFLRPDVKFIYMSGYARHDYMLRASAGAGEDVPFLEKPFPIQQLADTIRQVLEEDEPSST